MKGWALSKADAEAAFLQTGSSQRDVYLIHPKKSRGRSVYWLLLRAAYILVNANAKWQHQSDEKIKEKGRTQVYVTLQLLYLYRDSKLVLLVAKIFNELLITGEPKDQKQFIKGFYEKFKLGTVTHGPG